MRVVFDTEATGLDVERDKVHCLVAYDLDAKRFYEFTPNDLHKLPKFFEKVTLAIAHNGLCYDFPILRHNLGVEYKGKIEDTLIWSRLLNPDRGGHGVEWWGKQFGLHKPEHEDWSRFTPAMLHRCREDVKIQVRIWQQIEKEREGWDWSLAYRIEVGAALAASEQEKIGVAFDLPKAKQLVADLETQMEEEYAKLKGLLGCWPKQVGAEVKAPFKKNGEYTHHVQQWIETTGMDAKIGGPFTRIEWQPIELSQRDKVAKRLMALGWKPSSYTEKGSPQLTPNKEPCPNLMKMGNAAGQVLAIYSKLQHRCGQIKGWVENCEQRGDGRVSARITGITNTGRRKHGIVANVPKAKEHVFLGKEMRSLFIAKPGYKMVGWDAASMQLRIGAHYSKDAAFVKALVEGKEEDGTDAHSLVTKDAGLANRDEGKRAVYCGIFGGSEKRFIAEFGPTGAKVREAVIARFPGVINLGDRVKKAAQRGYLKGIDGRKIWLRRDEQGKVKTHTGLVTLIQSCEGILMALVYGLLHHKIKQEGLDARIVVFMHDEMQAEVHPKDIARYEELSRACMKQAEMVFNFFCPLDIEAKVGADWSETH